MTAAALARTREFATLAARREIERCVGSLILNKTADAVEQAWARKFVSTWVAAFAFFSAAELSESDDDAFDVFSDPEVQGEIRTRVEAILAATVTP